MTPPARLQLFGYPQLYDASGAAVPLGMRAAALLGILAAEAMPVSRARLAALLWADRATEQARASLRQCLLELRRSTAAHDLPMPVAGDTRSLNLVAGDLENDLAALRSACESGDLPALTAVLAAAPPRALLDDIALQGEFSDWRRDLQARVDAQVHTALGRMFASGADNASLAALAHARLRHAPRCPHARTHIGDTIAPLAEFRVAETPLALPVSPRISAPALPADAPPAVVVQRLEPLSDGAPPSGMLHAMREEVVAGLSRFRELRVVVLPDDPVAIEPARLPQSGYSLAMTLRTTSDGQAIAARLTALGSGELLWGDRFRVTDADLQPTIDNIISRIVAAVPQSVEDHLTTLSDDRPAGALYARYLAAKQRSKAPATHAEALALADEFEAILAQAPRFAAAHLPLARLYNTDFVWTRAQSSTPERRARAMQLASSAVALDRGSAHGQSLLGWCHLWRGEWAAARRFFDEAVRLNPYHAVRLMEVAYGLLHLGDLDASEALLRRCLTITPISDDGFFYDLGMVALVGGDPVRATEHLSMVAAPDVWGHIAIALAAVQSGKAADAPRAGARRVVAAMWPGGRLPALAAVHDWIVARHPFRLRAHRDRYLDGLSQIFG